jgi:predicted RecB family nuclease
VTDQRFSGPGEPPTDFERELLANNDRLEDIWADIGKQIGATALRVVLDRLAGEIVSVPTWSGLMRRLYLPIRDAEILSLSGRLSEKQLAERYGMCPQNVRKARSRALRTRHGRR